MGFFVLKDFRDIVDGHGIQSTRCVICHGNGKVQSFEIFNNTRDKKGFITYNPKHGINNMKKHVENEHVVDLARYKSEVVAIKGFGDGCKTAKKCSTIFPSTITAFFGFKKTYHMINLSQKRF